MLFNADTKLISLTNGKILLMVNGYTFHKGGGHIRCFGGVKWRCSASKKKCKAYVAMSDQDDYVIRYYLNHNDHEHDKLSSTSIDECNIAEETDDVCNDVFLDIDRSNNRPARLTVLLQDIKHSDMKETHRSTTTEINDRAPEAVNNNAVEDSSTPSNIRKRTLNPQAWADVKRKKLLNSGKKYRSRTGRIVKERIMGPTCNCKFQCGTKISEDERIRFFKKFWELGDREKQWLWIVKYTKKHNKLRTTLQRKLMYNRQYTYRYYLPIDKKGDVIKAKVNVCKIMFQNTLNIGNSMVKTAWEKYDSDNTIKADMRGRHNNHRRIIDKDMTASVCDHVRTFEPVKSSNRSHILYLNGSLNFTRMFDLYWKWPDLKNYAKRASTVRQYRDIVNKHFNVTFC
ncbi:unnamed protein product, partial [Brenthis ino]